MSLIKDCRGYISSRSFSGNWVPQHIQNTIIRDFCNKNNCYYLLSAAEYAIPNCYMVLEEMAQESTRLDGIVLYSIYQLPQNENHRLELCELILNNNCSIFSSVENMKITNLDELHGANVVLNLNNILHECISSIGS